MFIRNCPICASIIKYSNKYNFQKSVDKNSLCKQCRGANSFKKINYEVKNGLRLNGFKNKTHNNVTIQKLKKSDKSYTKTIDFKNKISKSNIGRNNPMYGRSYYDIWIEKYGKEVADNKLKQKSLKHSIKNKGKNNPMFGKPSPSGSGNGWKGWYKGIFFRSLHELSFLINYIERFKIDFESGEKAKWAIEYKKPTGGIGTYFPDYIINGKYMVEIKPKRLINTPLIKAKSKAAIIFCKKHNLKYKIITPHICNILENINNIKFTESSKNKISNYFGINI